MVKEEKEIFDNVLKHFQKKYPSSNITCIGSLITVKVYVRNEGYFVNKTFNTDGYNLLYCLTELTNLLRDELR